MGNEQVMVTVDALHIDALVIIIRLKKVLHNNTATSWWVPDLSLIQLLDNHCTKEAVVQA